MTQTVTATEINILADYIAETLNLNESESDYLATELADHGIETMEQFDDAFYGSYNAYNPEADFAEQFYNELGEVSQDSPLYSFIDWQQVWDCQLRYDFFNVGEFFFRNI